MYATLPALLEPPSPPESVRTPPHGGAESDADDADTSWLGASPGEICASPEMEMCVEALRHLKNDADGRPKNAKRREDAKTRVARKLATNVGVDGARATRRAPTGRPPRHFLEKPRTARVLFSRLKTRARNNCK